MRNPALLFLLGSFGFSWTLAEFGFRVFPDSSTTMMVTAMVFMWGPAFGAWLACRYGHGESVRTLGPMIRWSPWLIVAATGPLLFAMLHLLVGVLPAGVSLITDSTALRDSIMALVPEAQRELAGEQLAAIGDWLIPVLLLQTVLNGILAGATINALFAFGEELGWRGYCQRWLATLGFWRGNFVIGIIWGLWHAPLILRGHNYPDHPELGVLMMTLFCIALSPWLSHVREQAGSVYAAAVMHGTLNATGGVLIFLAGASDLWRGPAGGAGIIALVVANLGLWWLRNRKTSEG